MYFQDCVNVWEIKKLYRQLAMENHPDMGGETATMQEINAAYHQALNRSDGQTSKGFDGKDHTYYYNQEVEQAVMDKINELLGLKLEGIEIHLVGVWVWVDGDTWPVKAELTSVGMSWHGKRKKWCWHSKGSRSRYNKSASFGDLQQMYGSKTFRADKEDKIALPA